MALLAALGAGGSALGGIGSMVGGLLNYKSQQDALSWTKRAQQISWEREDTSVARRAKDLEAAGLSKTLAAGSSAQTMAPIRVEAPQLDTTAITKGFSGISEGAQSWLAMTAQKAQIDKTVEENKLLRLQQNRQELENAFMTQANPLNLQGIQQEVEFSKLANPQRLAKLAVENEHIGIQNKNAKLDSQLKTIGIDQATVDLIGAKITNEAKTLGLTQIQKDIISKQLAIETAQLQLENGKYSRDWYRAKGLPTDFSFGGGPFQASAALGGVIGDKLKNLFRTR